MRFGQPFKTLLQQWNSVYSELITACNAVEENKLNYRNGSGSGTGRKGGGREKVGGGEREGEGVVERLGTPIGACRSGYRHL